MELIMKRAPEIRKPSARNARNNHTTEIDGDYARLRHRPSRYDISAAAFRDILERDYNTNFDNIYTQKAMRNFLYKLLLYVDKTYHAGNATPESIDAMQKVKPNQSDIVNVIWLEDYLLYDAESPMNNNLQFFDNAIKFAAAHGIRKKPIKLYPEGSPFSAHASFMKTANLFYYHNIWNMLM